MERVYFPGPAMLCRGTGRAALLSVLAGCLAAGWVEAQPAQPGRATVPGGRLEPLPLTQLDERAMAVELDSRTFTLTFSQPLPVRDLLLLLVRGTSLSVVPDPAITGSFIGELKNVTVRQALALVLQPLGLDFAVDGSFIRVFRRQPETRIFDVAYLAASRTGSSVVGRRIEQGSFARVTTAVDANVFDDLAHTVDGLLTAGATYSLDRKAGLLHVTDYPERLDRVAAYLDAVHDRVHRQVQVEARVIEVQLNDPTADTLDWEALARAVGDVKPGRSLLNGLRVRDIAGFLTALQSQGQVSVLASPRLLVLNNEPAVIRTSIDPAAAGVRQSDVASAELSIGVTPRIESDGVVMLSVTPIVERLRKAGDKGKVPAPTVQEVDTIARIADGETIALGGLTGAGRESGSNGGLRLFGRPVSHDQGSRSEVLVLVTARIMAAVGTR